MASGSLGLKRKTKPSASSIAKRLKTKHVLTDDLPWKKVSKPREADLGTGMDGFLELEEVDDIDIVFEETDAGRVVKFKVRMRIGVAVELVGQMLCTRCARRRTEAKTAWRMHERLLESRLR